MRESALQTCVVDQCRIFAHRGNVKYNLYLCGFRYLAVTLMDFRGRAHRIWQNKAKEKPS